MPRKEHFLLLDFLRGIAALAVLLLHFCVAQNSTLFGSAYLAVDFFFLLSGFVIAQSYETRLLSRAMPASRFMLVRIIRLYPLIPIAIALELGRRLTAAIVLNGEPLTAAYWLAAAANALMIPIPFDAGLGEQIYPLNPPLWSLFFEMLVNLAYAVWLVRLRNGTLFCVAIAALAGLIALTFAGVVAVPGELDSGAETRDMITGVPRVFFSFSIGVLLFRLRATGRLPLWSAGPLILSALLIVIFAAPGPFWTLAGQIAFVVLAFPPIVLLAANYQPKGLFARVSRLFGDLSYPIYILHTALLGLFLRALYWAHLQPDHIDAAVTISGTLFVCAGSWIVLQVYDGPLRAWLSRRLSERIKRAERIGVPAGVD